jgi:hypothetical protein
VNRSLTTIVGFGVVAAILMALLSAFYLKQIPNREDIESLVADLTAEYGPVLDRSSPLDVELIMPAEEGDPIGVRISCALRADVRKRAETVDVQLDRIAESTLQHRDWRGRVGYATVVHTPEPRRERRVAARTSSADLGDGRGKG